MAYMLAVDGGGSKTTAVIVDDDGDLLGYGKSGCSNHQVCGREVAYFSIETAVHQALRMAEMDPSEIIYSVFSLAGLDRDRDYLIMEKSIQELSFYSYQLVPDTITGLCMGSSDLTGIVLICGSGSNAFGRNTLGETIQIGGFGWLYGDCAGGREMAREAFRSSIRSYEGREVQSILTTMIPSHMGYPSMDSMIQDALDQGLTDVPITLTEVLHLADSQGDDLANRILRDAGMELGKAGLAVHRYMSQLGGFHQGNGKIPVVLVGSVLQKGKNPTLVHSLKSTMQGDQFAWIMPEFDPVFGAVLYGWRHLKVDNDREIVIEHFIKGSEQLG